MRQGGIEAEVPPSLEGKQRLFRALCNVWQPQPLSVDYLNAQDAELQAQMADKGVVKPEGSNITLWQGDITRLQADAIVNAANSQGLGCWHPLHSCIANMSSTPWVPSSQRVYPPKSKSNNWPTATRTVCIWPKPTAAAALPSAAFPQASFVSPTAGRPR